MYNYHADIVWQINKALLFVSLSLSVIIIIYAWLRNEFMSWRVRNLEAIRQNLRNLALSGKEAIKETCPAIINRASLDQFLSLLKQRQGILPKGHEGELRVCFADSGKIPELERYARSKRNKWRRIQALISLGYTESKSAIDILKKSLKDKDEDVAYFSMLSLAELRTVAAARILLDYLEKHPASGYKIISLLEKFPPEIIEDVLACTENKDPVVRAWSATLLSKVITAEYLKKAEDLTKDPSPDVRASACESLARIGRKEAKDALLARLKDDFWFVRMHAVRALATILKEESIPYLEKLKEDRSWMVRDAVLNVLKSQARHDLKG